jgi:hypothetical protein
MYELSTLFGQHNIGRVSPSALKKHGYAIKGFPVKFGNINRYNKTVCGLVKRALLDNKITLVKVDIGNGK